MKLMVRAAGTAALVLAAGTCLVAWGGPVRAWQVDAPPVLTTWEDHETATLAPDTFGLNSPAIADAREADGATSEPPAPTLAELVESKASATPDDEEQSCLASAVYFEAQGEPLEGQLAVAEVVLNRVRSPRFPDTVCGVVRQAAQFSFVRGGRIPRADRRLPAWRRAVAIARIAKGNAAPRQLSAGVLWYHARYVRPGWGRRLERSASIGLHIFYS